MTSVLRAAAGGDDRPPRRSCEVVALLIHPFAVRRTPRYNIKPDNPFDAGPVARVCARLLHLRPRPEVQPFVGRSLAGAFPPRLILSRCRALAPGLAPFMNSTHARTPNAVHPLPREACRFSSAYGSIPCRSPRGGGGTESTA